MNLDKIIDFLDKLPTEKFDFSLVRSQCESIVQALWDGSQAYSRKWSIWYVALGLVRYGRFGLC